MPIHGNTLNYKVNLKQCDLYLNTLRTCKIATTINITKNLASDGILSVTLGQQ